MKISIRRLGLAALLLACVGHPASAQTFPSKNVTMIVPFPPGGGNDIVGRYIADELSKKWDKPVIVENRGGAGGSIGSGTVARATPDGHTILFISASYTTNAATIPNMTFDSINDLTLVATTGTTDQVVTVTPDVPVNTLKELIELGNKQRLHAGTIGGVTEFGTLLLIDASKLNIVRVPYKGAGDIFPDLLGGRLQMYIGTTSAVVPFLQDKKLKALAVSGKERIKTLPDTPTYTELGFGEASTEVWWGAFVPSKTPLAIQEQINRDIGEIMSKPAWTEFLAKQDARPKAVTLKEGAELVKSEIGKWKALVEKYNLKPN